MGIGANCRSKLNIGNDFGQRERQCLNDADIRSVKNCGFCDIGGNSKRKSK